jgi:hypothetical protein
VKNFFARFSSKPREPEPPNPIRDIAFVKAMERYSQFDPQPQQRHFIQAFAVALALHTDGIARNLLLNKDIPDWEKIGTAGSPGAIGSFASYFGLRLTKLTASDFAEHEEQDEIGQQMVRDCLATGGEMYGQDDAATEAFDKEIALEKEMIEGKITSAQLTLRHVEMLDALLGLPKRDSGEPEAFKTAMNKAAAITGAVLAARSDFFNTVSGYMEGK